MAFVRTHSLSISFQLCTILCNTLFVTCSEAFTSSEIVYTSSKFHKEGDIPICMTSLFYTLKIVTGITHTTTIVTLLQYFEEAN